MFALLYTNEKSYSKMANFNQAKTYIYDHVRLRAEEQIGLHSQPTWELSYIVKGRGMRVVGDHQERFEAGEVVLVPPGMPHCWYFEASNENDTIENICLQISGEWLGRLAENLPETAVAIAHILSINTAVKFCGETARQIATAIVAMDSQTPLLRLSTFLRVIELLAADAVTEDIGRQIIIDRNEERRKNIEIYVACNFQRDITLAAVARHVGLSRTAFCRWMRQQMHTTFATYVLRIRLQKAADALHDTPDLPISHIAYQSGFSDVSHFNRMFKREFGLSPKRYAEGFTD